MAAEKIASNPTQASGPDVPPLRLNRAAVTRKSTIILISRCQGMRRLKIASSEIPMFHTAPASIPALAAQLKEPEISRALAAPSSNSQRRQIANQSAR